MADNDAAAPQDAPQAPEAQEEADAAQKRSEAAQKGAATKAANARQEAAVQELYLHLRHTIGAEVTIDQARQIVDKVLTATAAE